MTGGDTTTTGTTGTVAADVVSATVQGSRARNLAAGAGRAVGYGVGFVALLAVTFWILGIAPVKALAALWTGAAGTSGGHLNALSESLVEASPLLLTGLGVVVAWRAGLFSIGGEGQLLVGALAAASLGHIGQKLPGGVLLVSMLVVGVAAGAIWGGIAGWLRTRRGVQEVISTIMLNYAAVFLTGWAVGAGGPLQEHEHIKLQSDPLPDAALFARVLPRVWTNGMVTRLHGGVVLALIVAPLVALFLFRTRTGFGLRLLGQNSEAARVARFPVGELQMRAMLISGGLCGLAGATELLGGTGSLSTTLSPGWGFTAVPVALLGGLNPLGTLLSAIFFGALTAGSSEMERNVGVPAVVINVVQAAAVLAVVGIRARQARRVGGEQAE